MHESFFSQAIANVRGLVGPNKCICGQYDEKMAMRQWGLGPKLPLTLLLLAYLGHQTAPVTPCGGQF